VLLAGVLVAAALVGVAANYLLGPFFERSTLIEANPLAAAVADPPGGGGRGDAAAATTAAPSAAATSAAQAPRGASPTPGGVVSPTAPGGASPTVGGGASPTAGASATQAPRGPRLVAQGTFQDGAPGHWGKGIAQIGRDSTGKAVLVLSEFSVLNGPDLHVVLSDQPGGSGDGIDLGALKATDGTFSYDVPASVDLSSIRSVTIFCKRFPTVFAFADLK
jgi:hypothetical protein